MKNTFVFQAHASQSMLLHFLLPVKGAAAAVSPREGATGPAATWTGLETPLIGGGRLELSRLEFWRGLELGSLAGKVGGLLEGVRLRARRAFLAAAAVQ